MSEQACPGPCNRGWRRAQDEYKRAVQAYDPLDPGQSRPEPPQLQPWPGEPVWCSSCKPSIRLQLAELDTLSALLAAEADGHRGTGETERVSSRAIHPPSPSPAADDLDEIAAMLAGWESDYRDLKGWPSPPPRGSLASAETERIAWLTRHLDGILAHPDIGADFGLEILSYHRGMMSRAKAGVRTLRKPVRCPQCRLLTLVWTEGADRVECQNPDCASVLSYAQYEAALLHQAGLHGGGWA